MEQKLIQAGINNLKEFGYPDVDMDNILTDEIYKAFFLTMLKDNKGHRVDIDAAIDRLIMKIEG